MEESLRKVLNSYGLVKDNDELNNRLIERVVKIVLKEFELRNKFEVDDGPISISGSSETKSTPSRPAANAPINKAQAHFAATIANATKNNPKLEGMKKALQESFEKIDPVITEPDSEVVSEDEGLPRDSTPVADGESGVEMVLDSGTQLPFTPHRVLPAKLDEDAEQRVTQSGVRSIRRMS
jgi:hypothetical protein